MSVRRIVRKLRDGTLKRFWVADVEYRGADGQPKRVRRRPRRQTKIDAQDLEREILQFLKKSGRQDENHQQTQLPRFEEFAADFMQNYAKANNKPSEYHSKAVLLRLHLVPAFGNFKLDEICVRGVEQYKASALERGLAAKTVNNHLALLRRMLRVAGEWDLLDKAIAVKSLKVTPCQASFLSPLQATQLLMNCAPPWKLMVMTALHTGMRLGELLALTWGDINFSVGQITVRRNNWKGIISTPKSGRQREIPLTTELHDRLEEAQGDENGWVFARADGSPLTYQQCRRPLMRACAEAQVPSVQWHGLRHTFASHLAMKGAPLKAIQELLGHSTQAMTERYAHLLPSVRRDAISLLTA